MWRQCGVRRSGEGLRDALDSIDQWRRYVLPRQFDDIDGWELQNLLTIARIMIQASLLREESRGVHLRTDHPGLDDAGWNKHLWFERSEIQPLERWGSA
jgi:L-aspartate oxidase